MLVMLLLHPGPIKETSTQIFTFFFFLLFYSFVIKNIFFEGHRYTITRNKKKIQEIFYLIYLFLLLYLRLYSKGGICCHKILFEFMLRVYDFICIHGEMLHVAANVE